MDLVVGAVKTLRHELGDSQQAFANRLGLSIRAIANYEKDRRPTGMALASLARAASDARKQDLINTFMSALVEELGLQDISFRLMAGSIKDGSLQGLIFAHLPDKESIEYGWAFWHALEDLNSADPETKARARKRLGQLRDAVDTDPERQIPAWARPPAVEPKMRRLKTDPRTRSK
jgi:transcriptional regulator with XRE-family HTH domain